MSDESAVTERVQAVCVAIGPYGWRALTAEMVARRLLGAVDRLSVLELIGATTAVSDPHLAAVCPVGGDDDRLEPLVHLMAGFRWRDVTLTRLVQLLLEALDQWWAQREAFEHALARLLDDQH